MDPVAIQHEIQAEFGVALVFLVVTGVSAQRDADAIRESRGLLQSRTEELETFNRAMVDREQRIIEIEKEVNALCAALGREPPYPPVCRKEPE